MLHVSSEQSLLVFIFFYKLSPIFSYHSVTLILCHKTWSYFVTAVDVQFPKSHFLMLFTEYCCT